MAPSLVKEPADAAEAEGMISGPGMCVLNFCATWAEPCTLCNAAFAELATEHTGLSFVQLDADTFPELCEKYALESVPAFLFVNAGKLIDQLIGADVPALVSKVKQHHLSVTIARDDTVDISAGSAAAGAGDAGARAAASTPSLDDRLKALTHKAPVMLFMKGTPDAPRCGFSRTAIELLRNAQIAFDTFDILSDEEVRQGLKKYSNWPTYPQLYGEGKLIGGLDIMKELNEEGELAESLPAVAMKTS